MHTRSRRLAAASLAAGAAFGAAYPYVAHATGPHVPTCTYIVHDNKDGVTTDAGGKVDQVDGGLKITTAVNDDRVKWKRTLATPVPMKDVTALTYTNRKIDDGKTNAAALVAYHVYLAVPTGTGTTTTTLVYEPYYQITGNPELHKTKTWDVKAGKFWTGTTIPGMTAEGGGSYAGNKTWAQILAANPDAKVTGYGWGQGTYNAGTISELIKPERLRGALEFKSLTVRECHSWTKPKPHPTHTATVPPTKPPTATPTVKPPTQTTSPPASPTSPHTTAPAGGGDSYTQGGLAQTGFRVANFAAFGAFAVVLGGVLFAATYIRRRRNNT